MELKKNSGELQVRGWEETWNRRRCKASYIFAITFDICIAVAI